MDGNFEIPVTELDTGIGSLSRQIRVIHERLLEVAPDVSRMACALYEPKDDLLKTFINSTREGVALHGYQYRLSDSESLSSSARTHMPRLLTDLPAVLQPDTAHSSYVLNEGYRSSFTVPMLHRGQFIGFIFFDSKRGDTFTAELVRELILYAGLITMAVGNELMSISSVVGTMQVARDFTEFRDHETGSHLDRMSRYSRIMARDTSAKFGFDDEQVELIMLYAPMHDIGKIGVPDAVLQKPGKLTPEEWVVMKSHATKGARMVDTILSDMGMIDLPEPQFLRDLVEFHHERLDGSGYPRGLRGDEVPPVARIIAVADVFDALTSRRCYKPSWTVDEAFAELRSEVDRGLLDVDCVNALEAARDEVEVIRLAHPDLEENVLESSPCAM